MPRGNFQSKSAFSGKIGVFGRFSGVFGILMLSFLSKSAFLWRFPSKSAIFLRFFHLNGVIVLLYAAGKLGFTITYPKLTGLTQNLPNLPKTYWTYPKLTGLNQILPDLLKNYPTYTKLSRLTQNLPDLPKTYPTYTKLNRLTQNLPDLPKTY